MRNGVKNSRFQCIILTISSALWYYKIYNKDNYTLLRYMKRGIKMKRKAVSIILALSMLLPTLNFAVSADEIKTEINSEQTEVLATSSPNEKSTEENIAATNVPLDNSTDTVNINKNDVAPMTDGTDLSSDLQNGDVTINTNGTYYIGSVDVTNTVTVKTGVKADLTVENVTMTSATSSPIIIESGAVVNLHINGTNTVIAKKNGKAGINVAANSIESDYSILTVDGDGILNVTGTAQASGIGANLYQLHGKIIINGGTINAVGGMKGTAIGGGVKTSGNVSGCTIEINGGIINASAGRYGTAIGGVERQSNAEIIVNGGYIKATADASMTYSIGPGRMTPTTEQFGVNNIYINGGSVDGTFRSTDYDKVQDKDGNKLKQVVLTMPDAVEMANKEVTVGSWKTVTDSEAKLYVYVTEDTTGYAVTYAGKIYRTDDIENQTTLTEYSGSDCTCTDANSSIKLSVPDEITVNKIVGQTKIKLTTDFEKSSDCTYPTHILNCTYTLTTADENETAISSDLAEVVDGYIVAHYKQGTHKIRVKVTATLNGYIFNNSKDISLTGDDKSQFDISKGNIKITKNNDNNDMVTVTVGTTSYDIPKNMEIYIVQSTSQTSNVIEVVQGANPTIVLDNINILSRSSINNALTIGDDVELTLRLKGTNKIESQSVNLAAVRGITATSKLIVEDSGDNDGVITFKSANGAGIGDMKQFTVNSGTVYAYGGNGGAGIGGGKDGSGINVLINGGNVYAYADDDSESNAAGIGGGTGSASGTSGRGGNVIVNGGYVKAVGNGSGYGIGNGGNKTPYGTITINGGSVDATLGTTPNNDPSFDAFNNSGTIPATKYNQYLVETTVDGITDEQDVEYSLVSDNDTGAEKKIKTRTDKNGKLYLYANAGNQWIRVYKNGTTYYRYSKVDSMSKNTFNCTNNTEISVSSFKIPGQIGDTVIDNENRVISVKVPYNIILKNITPNIEFIGAFTQKDAMKFNNTTSATYKITGNDKSEVTYTVNLTLDSEHTEKQADVYDVSNGSVYVTDLYVTYGGVQYKTNDLGYVIMGTSTENIVNLDSATKLPPVTLKNLDIKMSNSATPINIMGNVDITIDGNCTLRSMMGNAISVKNSYSNNPQPTIKSTETNPLANLLDVQGGIGANAVNTEANTKLTITGVPTNLTAVTGTAVGGDGEFITDSKTYINIAENSTSTVKNANGDNLYQVKATLNGAKGTENICTYEDTDYYIGDDHILCLMVPNGSYNMSVGYSEDDYSGTIEVDSAMAEGILYSVYVESVTYDSSQKDNKGGKVDFTVKGVSIIGNVKIRVKSLEDIPLVLESDVIKDSDGNYVASITLPENQSAEKPVVYEVYYDVKNKETKLKNNLIVDYDKSVCSITNFEIDGQLGQSTIYESEDSHTITVYMPYDHEYQDYYTPSKLTYIGGRISNDQGKPIQYTVDINGYARTKYTVTAQDGTTTADYMIKIYKEATPVITSLSLRNPTSSAASTVTVKIIGRALSSIKNAENENNRKVYIYSDDGLDPVEATYDLVNGVDIYTAEINIPENTSDTEDKIYTLKAKIGDTEQTSVNSTIRVPRKERGLIGINDFTINNQIGDTKISGEQGKNISITMPFDADITSLLPNVELEDMYATYSPATEQDFTSDVVYTVTAEDKVTTKDYTVHVEKQAAPQVNSITFEDPEQNSESRVQVRINGDNLDNAANALNHEKTITVSAKLVSGEFEGSGISTAIAQVDETGNYIATLNVPKNDNDTKRVYELSVSACGEKQDLSGNTTLTVPERKSNRKELTDFVVSENQSEISRNGNKLYLYVPYNTNLNNVIPKVSHTGVSYTPTDAQDLNSTKEYTVIAEDGTKNVYQINVLREGVAKVNNVNINQPKTFNDTDITVDITGQFIPYLRDDEVKDTMEVVAVPRGDGETQKVMLEYDGYGGHAIGKVTLPQNDTSEDKKYDFKITINGREQQIGLSGIVTVPRKESCRITGFRINNQTKDAEINDDDNTITLYMPYTTDLTALTPKVDIDGKDYTPKGTQDFTNPVQYTVTGDGGVSKTYTVTVKRSGMPTITSVSVSNAPETFKGSDVKVEMSGIFNESMKVYAVSEDGNSKIECHDVVVGDVTDGFRSASASITMPENDDTENSKNYTLVFDVDGFENVSYVPLKTVTVPRRKTRTITNFYVQNQVGSADIQDKDVYVKVQYDTDISKLTPNLRIDGDSYAPEGEQNFDNETKSLVYKVSAADDVDREYTVHISRDGKPTINEVSYTSPVTFKGGLVTVGLNGIFFEDVKVYAVPISGGAKIEGKTISFEDKSATATLNIPTNYNTESEQEYRIEFVIDGFDTNYSSETKITVPRRTTRKITEFTLPDVQEGETKIDGTDIYISSPYIYDLSSVTPQITFDADEISPSADTAQDFSNLDNPVKYTLSSAADEDVTYTVHIERVGDDPYLERLTVDGQYGETEYEDDNVKLVLKSSAKLNSVEPVLQIHGDDYSPKGAQDFTDSEKNPVVYTVKNKYGVEHKYYVTITKKRSSGGNKGSSATPTPTPTETPITTVEPTNSPKPNDGNQTPNPTEMPITKHEPYISGYEENGVVQFRPDNTITRAEVAKILTVLDGDFDVNKTYANKFSDVHDGTWYQNYINFAVEKNYISGDENGLCRPEDMISRAEFASIIARYINIEPLDGEDKFTDIARFDWCKKYINALAEKGIVTGYENDEFLPDNKLTRSEAVAIINRITDRKMTPEILEKLTCPFSDVSETHWAYNDILLAACEY